MSTIPTLCLNMIVKNESKIITRMFDTVVNIIDCYVICDTGSTDNTIEVITNYFKEKNISGKVVQEPFKNFCHNRNFALNSCIGMSDYVLLIDADMKLVIGDFNKSKLGEYDCYHILQGNDDFYYKNMRIVRNTGKCSYIGVTHEYINIPGEYRTGDFKKNELFINDIGDGGCKSDKFERDVRLLTDGIDKEPNNVRYHFYLANSLFDLGRYDDAILYYKKRIEFGGWKEEVWFSYFKIGMAYKNKSDMGNAIKYWCDGYDYYPERLEGIFEIIHYYRNLGKQRIGYEFYKMAKNILDKNYNYDGCLFHHNDVYTYKLAYEYTLLAAYVGIYNINNEIVEILNHSNDNNMNLNVIKNMKFYKFILNQKARRIFDDNIIKNINNKDIKFNSSSSCMIKNSDGDGYIMNVRYVNYNIDNNGGYHDCSDHIITMNKRVDLDNNFNIIKEEFCDFNFDGRRYIGIEDIRIINTINNIKFIGTGYHMNETIGIVEGDYDNINNITELKQDFKNTSCEKNWVYIDSNRIIYEWYPLRIGIINNNNLTINEEHNMPKIFRYIRGSTCGFDHNNEYWFVVHLVSYDSPRDYYHLVVVFDKNMNLLRYTAPFKFEGEPIEYCLSICINDNKVYINYSTWDRTTRIGMYDLDYIESIMYHNK
jgi:tetratricopeptide (TPR) repeat protein